MTNKYKKLTKASLAAVLVTSAIVPVAAAATPAASTTEVAYVIIEQDGKLVKISIGDYSELLGAGENPAVKFITLSNEETFTIDQFTDVLGATLDLTETLEVLAEEETPATPADVLTGTLDPITGELVIDQTPEEKVNETFFYNLAA